MTLREIFDLHIYFRPMRWSYIVNGLRKLNKDEFSCLLISEIIGKQNENYRMNFEHLFLI